jgi:hypothetical protein
MWSVVGEGLLKFRVESNRHSASAGSTNRIWPISYRLSSGHVQSRIHISLPRNVNRAGSIDSAFGSPYLTNAPFIHLSQNTQSRRSSRSTVPELRVIQFAAAPNATLHA